MSETSRVLYQIKLRNSASCWLLLLGRVYRFYCKDVFTDFIVGTCLQILSINCRIMYLLVLSELFTLS